MKLFQLMAIGCLAFSLIACSSTEEGEENGKFVSKHKSAIVTKEVNYRSEHKNMTGFLAVPEGEGPFPGVLVVHEWWGQTEYPRQRAKQLAEAGYVAFAVDMYGEGKTVDHPKDAQSFSSKVMADMDEAETNFRAAMDALKNEEMVDKDQIAAIGYCFGGGVVLEMARRDIGLKMVASYHGNITPLVKNDVAPTKTRMLIFNGGADPFVKKEDLSEARAKLKAAKVRYKLVNFKGAKHGFTNPGATAKGEEFKLPLMYDERADTASWQQTLDAFKIVFK